MSSFFFNQLENEENKKILLKSLEEYADNNKKQIYVIDRPLGDSKYSYDYKNGMVVLIPGYKILFINFGPDNDEFDDYCEDFIEDLGSISDKFQYKGIIGRPRKWKNNFTKRITFSEDLNLNSVLSENNLDNGVDKRNCELIISLLTGSINDIDKVGDGIPNNLLDKIKRKILLFDGDQTRFVYQKNTKKRISIQGLSGTGKTELLLHKLKEIYTENDNVKIFFTCHNRILADNLRRRIPGFFDFMKVEEQIKWNERLWCSNAWGNQSDKDSGMYSYICDYYDIPFYRYSKKNTFDVVCGEAAKLITEDMIEERGFAFDFILIDESQDFPNSFFNLCEKIARNTVYIAGDIFQSIFDDNILTKVEPDFLLSKCYRTDPRTLMFAHALGLGLWEKPHLGWLEDKEWKACGYLLNNIDNNKKIELSREPLRRFEDIDSQNFSSVELKDLEDFTPLSVESQIITIINEIKKENPTVLADDIGLIFLDNSQISYQIADMLEESITKEFDWKVNKAYETKEKLNDSLFISNRNNVKGLEFPFVICISERIEPNRSYRNTLYTMLTRSFLKTYFIISKNENAELVEQLKHELSKINQQEKITVDIPSPPEIAEIKRTISLSENRIPFNDLILQTATEIGIPSKYRKQLITVVKNTIGECFDEDEIEEVLRFGLKKIQKNEQ